MKPVYGPFLSRAQALEKGLKQYFDGRVCRRGHLSSRRVNPDACAECMRESKRRPLAPLKKCDQCGAEFRSQVRTRPVRFCSPHCNTTFNNQKKSAALRAKREKKEMLMQWLPGYMPRSTARELGLKHYFVGCRCPRGHVAPHLVTGGCSVCLLTYSREWVKADRSKNPEKYRERDRMRVRPRTDEQRELEAKHREAHRDKIRAYGREYNAERRARDPQYRLRCGLHSRITVALRKGYGKKAHKTMELLGCSIEYLTQYLEVQFKPGMTWENYGRNGWHVDHIVPCTAFDLSDPVEQKRCFHYSNLQPLWEAENISKSNRMPSM
jgi:hypothetical protein